MSLFRNINIKYAAIAQNSIYALKYSFPSYSITKLYSQPSFHISNKQSHFVLHSYLFIRRMNFLMSRQFKSRSIGVGTSRKVTRKRLRCTVISIHMQSIVRFPYKRFVTSSLHILSRLPTDYKRTVSSLHEPFCGVIQVPIHQYSPSFQHISFDSVIHNLLQDR